MAGLPCSRQEYDFYVNSNLYGKGILLCKAIGSRSVIFHLDGSQEALVKIANSAIANEAL